MKSSCKLSWSTFKKHLICLFLWTSTITQLSLVQSCYDCYMQMHHITIIGLNYCCLYWGARSNGMVMVWIINSHWWKPGHWVPQLLHKHVFFFVFMRTFLQCGHLGTSSPTPSPPYTLFDYCTAKHSWHPFSGPCLLVWPTVGWALAVSSCMQHVMTHRQLLPKWRKSLS